MKEPSLVFVRSQSQALANLKPAQNDDDAPVLEMAPDTRILAKLQTEISSADPTTVVAVVQYTYAIGDQVMVPAGALIFGQLTHADRSGYVGVKFDEIQLSDGPKGEDRRCRQKSGHGANQRHRYRQEHREKLRYKGCIGNRFCRRYACG
jgi:hypothetical protein